MRGSRALERETLKETVVLRPVALWGALALKDNR
jgi:hypothetical protein